MDPNPSPTHPAPSISVALLVRNGLPELRYILSALNEQTGCGPFEIVAIDSGSTDGSIEAMAAAGVRVEQIDPSQFAFGATRQKLFGLTRGRVIVTLSQDAVPGGPTWLSAMTQPILSDRADLVQSMEQLPPEAQRLAFYQQYATAYRHWPMPWITASCSGLAISRAAWEKTGFGNVPMSEDKYLALQARREGLRMIIQDAVPLLHGHVFSMASLAKRAFNEGMGARRTEGRYSLRDLVSDLTNRLAIRKALEESLRFRTVRVREAAMLLVRPVFLFLGVRFGKRYWR